MYDVPGLGPVPEQFVPENLREVPSNDLYMGPPPQLPPEQMLAQNQSINDIQSNAPLTSEQPPGPPPAPDPRYSSVNDVQTNAPAPQQPVAPYQGGGGSSGINTPAPTPVEYTAEGNRPPQPQAPEQRLMREGSDSQGPGYNYSSNQNPAQAEPGKLPENVPLAGPGKAGKEGEADKKQADLALPAWLAGYMKGRPATVIPEHIARTAEVWTQKNMVAPPGTTTETKDLPEDAIPVWRDVEVGKKNGKAVYEKKLLFEHVSAEGKPEYESATKETPNNVITEGAKQRAEASQQELENMGEQQAYKKASRNLDVGNVMTDQAGREMQSVEDLRRRQAEQQAQLDKAQADFQATLSRINDLAGQAPPDPGLARKLTLGIGQGLIYAGAAAAGQQVPSHLDWIGQQIRLDVEKQRMQLEAGLHVAGLKLNALQALRQHMQSPEAAQHALAMADYTAAMHMVDGMVTENSSKDMIERAQLLKSQLATERDKQAELATEAEHVTQTQRIPRQVVAGKPGGYEGLREAAKAIFKEPKAQDEAVAHWADQIGRGESPTMPTDVGGEGQQMRAKEVIATNRAESTLQLDPTITGMSGTVYSQNDTKLVHEAKLAQSQGRAIIDSFEKLRDQNHRVGSKTVDRTAMAKIGIELQALEAKLLVAAKEGNTESKVEAMKIRSAREYLQDKMVAANVDEVIDFAENSALGAINSLIPLDQFTRTYRGDDYVRNNKREAMKVRE